MPLAAPTADAAGGNPLGSAEQNFDGDLRSNPRGPLAGSSPPIGGQSSQWRGRSVSTSFLTSRNCRESYPSRWSRK